MPKARLIYRQISHDENVASLSCDSARLLFTWMLIWLDREGRIQGEADMVKSVVAPRSKWTEKQVEGWLQEMVDIGLIVRYKVKNFQYIFKPHFTDYQSGLNKEAPSTLPAPSPDQLPTNSGVAPAQLQTKSEPRARASTATATSTSSSTSTATATDIGAAFKAYEENIGQLTAKVSDDIQDVLAKYSVDQFIAACKQAKGKGHSVNYLRPILADDNSNGGSNPQPERQPTEEELNGSVYRSGQRRAPIKRLN